MFLELPILNTTSEKKKPAIWRSPDQLEGKASYRSLVENEFMPGATEGPTNTSRRRFLEIMGASMAMAGLAACRKPVEKILPYNKRPEDVIPGKPLYYASAMPLSGVLRGVLVESHEGRPTKMEGNPDHPVSKGATGVFEQASVLTLYDPDRSRYPRQNGKKASWDDFLVFCREQLADARNKHIAVVAEASSSATLAMLRRKMEQTYGRVTWVTYEPAGDRRAEQGAQLLFGRPYRPLYRFSRAKTIVSLDADFLGPTDPNHVQNTREYANSRRVMSEKDDMSRLYVIESTYTVTGGMADHRLPLKSGEIPAFLAALASAVGIPGFREAGRPFATHLWVEVIAEELLQHPGQSILVAGNHQSAAVHALTLLINRHLNNIGRTVELLDTGETGLPAQEEALRALTASLNQGDVDILVTLGTNPAYDAPADLKFADAMAKAKATIHVGLWRDETAQKSTWHLPQSHYLESWTDGRAYDGTLSVVQPLIAPLFDTKTDTEILHALTAGTWQSAYTLVREALRPFYGGDEKRWKRMLYDGFVPGSAYPTVTPSRTRSIARAYGQVFYPDPEAIELVIRPDATVYDGRFANNAWMQELPDPITKITWDNAALMSPATAERLGVDVRLYEGQHYADRIRLTVNGSSVELPVWIVPGHADNSITVHLGYGRQLETDRATRPAPPAYRVDTDIYRPGPLANGVGANVSVLRTTQLMDIVPQVAVEKVGSDYVVASTQDHHSMEGRHLAVVGTLATFREEPHFAQEKPPFEGYSSWEEFPTLWEDKDPWKDPSVTESTYHRNQWAMVIDLNVCTGCNACITACQSENNIQVVGKDQVTRGREMHWIRLDRYFTGEDVSKPGMVMQPVPCMQCEYAPCESVCPVAATSHSPDGINEMTYNRCIGTRYCSNNCPYKVRRFNWYNWTYTLPVEVQMQQNPNVTVRYRGVMEKCTYCVQRIREVQQTAKVEGRAIQDGDIQTACQQVCPAQAIVFGDLNDPNSEVNRWKQNPRRYDMLAELNLKTRTSYLARLRNPNPRLETEAS